MSRCQVMVSCMAPVGIAATYFRFRWSAFRPVGIKAATDCTLEMGRMSDYDIRPKPKVWAGSPNECRTFGRTFGQVLCARMKQRLLLVSALSG